MILFVITTQNKINSLTVNRFIDFFRVLFSEKLEILFKNFKDFRLLVHVTATCQLKDECKEGTQLLTYIGMEQAIETR